jgi:hypothetical protein
MKILKSIIGPAIFLVSSCSFELKVSDDNTFSISNNTARFLYNVGVFSSDSAIYGAGNHKSNALPPGGISSNKKLTFTTIDATPFDLSGAPRFLIIEFSVFSNSTSLISTNVTNVSQTNIVTNSISNYSYSTISGDRYTDSTLRRLGSGTTNVIVISEKYSNSFGDSNFTWSFQ